MASGERLLLDADAGAALAPRRRRGARRFEARRGRRGSATRDAAAAAPRPGRTADGTAVTVLVNVDDPDLLDRLSPAICDGVGLTRTEFLFEHGAPDEEAQLARLRRILAWAGAGR